MYSSGALPPKLCLSHCLTGIEFGRRRFLRHKARQRKSHSSYETSPALCSTFIGFNTTGFPLQACKEIRLQLGGMNIQWKAWLLR